MLFTNYSTMILASPKKDVSYTVQCKSKTTLTSQLYMLIKTSHLIGWQ